MTPKSARLYVGYSGEVSFKYFARYWDGSTVTINVNGNIIRSSSGGGGTNPGGNGPIPLEPRPGGGGIPAITD